MSSNLDEVDALHNVIQNEKRDKQSDEKSDILNVHNNIFDIIKNNFYNYDKEDYIALPNLFTNQRIYNYNSNNKNKNDSFMNYTNNPVILKVMH